MSPPEFDRWAQLENGHFAMKAPGPDALGMTARIVEAEHAGHQVLRKWLLEDGRQAPAPLSDADLDHLGERIRACLAGDQAPAVNADQVHDLVAAARFFVDAADVDSAAAVPEEKALILALAPFDQAPTAEADQAAVNADQVRDLVRAARGFVAGEYDEVSDAADSVLQALAPFDLLRGATQDVARSAREVLTDQVASIMRQVEVVHGLDWFSIEEAAHSRHVADNGVIHTFSVAADDHGQVDQVERPDPVEPGSFCTSPAED